MLLLIVKASTGLELMAPLTQLSLGGGSQKNHSIGLNGKLVMNLITMEDVEDCL